VESLVIYNAIARSVLKIRDLHIDRLHLAALVLVLLEEEFQVVSDHQFVFQRARLVEYRPARERVLLVVALELHELVQEVSYAEERQAAPLQDETHQILVMPLKVSLAATM